MKKGKRRLLLFGGLLIFLSIGFYFLFGERWLAEAIRPRVVLPQPPFDLNTHAGVVADIMANVHDDRKELLRRTSKRDLIQFHHGWGTAIRNQYLLWSNPALLRSCAERLGRHGE